jgi:predicted dehydrogenase
MPKETDTEISRRAFLKTAGTGLAAIALAAETERQADALAPPSAPETKPIPLPPTSAATEKTPDPAPTPLAPGKRLGIAVVGLGNLALAQVIPAFGESKYCKLTALVSGSPGKAREVAEQHGVPARSLYSYESYDTIKNNPDVDIVYVILPNSLHAEYTVRGAQAGKHILCEKPMATSSAECQQMIDACRQANKKLMIAYRIQYEPNNRYMRQLVQSQQYGPIKIIEAVNGQNQGDPNQWRQKLALAGGGALPDVGLYCLNTTRFLTGEEPTEVIATTYRTPGDSRFVQVEESVLWQMRFPSGIQSNNTTSYGFHEDRRYRVHAAAGWFGLDPAFSYHGLQPELSYAAGKIEHRERPILGDKNQFALEMDHMALCVMQNQTPYTPGEEGLQDQRIIEAIYQSAKTGQPVGLPVITTRDTFRGTPPVDEG